ncbi:hypothetical protein [Streptomyces mobaraensis]|uniref:hypothetical protein n=1 Tax=Streptomyces mobaraensis TaxID=35621 RepID=UPI00340108C2
MSLGDDGYRSGQGSGGDGGGYGGYDADDHHLTRTRLPEGEVDPYAPQRRPVRPSRNLITIVAVVVLLVAAIAFANRGGDKSSHGDDENSAKGGSSATAPSGVKPVEGKNGGIASGFGHSEQGAQSAAANFAVALGSTDMFDADKRHDIVKTIMAPTSVDKYQKTLDSAYSTAFFKNLGLNDDGTTPKGYTFVSRTVPVGTKVTKADDDRPTVEVWCTGLVGLAGQGSTKPVANSWFTITMQLSWTDGDWKVAEHSQTSGPAPVNGDQPASGADAIANAVNGYGGFTYAR